MLLSFLTFKSSDHCESLWNTFNLFQLIPFFFVFQTFSKWMGQKPKMGHRKKAKKTYRETIYIVCNYVIETSSVRRRSLLKGECHSNHMLASYPGGVSYVWAAYRVMMSLMINDVGGHIVTGSAIVQTVLCCCSLVRRRPQGGGWESSCLQMQEFVCCFVSRCLDVHFQGCNLGLLSS